MAAGGLSLSGWHMGVALETVFEETTQVSDGRFHSFEVRCRASGLEEFIPSAKVDRSAPVTTDRRFHRGPPRKRIRALQSTPAEATEGCWRFVGHIQREACLRTQLASIEGSWRTTRSAWHAWAAFVDATAEGSSHFARVTEAQLGSFSSCFDAPSTLKKYIGYVKKAVLLLEGEFPQQHFVDGLLRGAAKFAPKPRKSYITAGAVAQMTEHLVKIGRVELAQFISVVYTFQLRVQSEALALQFDGRPPKGSTAMWHSAVEVEEKQVVIVLRIRKNSMDVSRVARRCICNDWPGKVICGVCSLKKIVRKRKDGVSGRVFPHVGNSDINILKEVGRNHNLGAVTWHGFRRGRTVDLLERGGANGVCLSLADLYQSGGWQYGSGALLSCIPEDAANKERVFRIAADASDTDDGM